MKKTWEFKNKSEEKDVGELYLYGEITSTTWFEDDVSPKQFKKDMDALGDINTLNIYINSPGGDVFASQAIYNMLKRHLATKNVYIDGIAASGASLVAMAGDMVYMPANAMIMVHNASTIMWGFADDFRKMADVLDQIQASMIPVYAEKTGLSDKEITELLDSETWMTAEDAKMFGFADEILEEKQIAASMSGGVLTVNGQQFDVKNFKSPPKLAFLPKDIPKIQEEEPKHEEKPDADRLFIYEKQIALKNKKYKYQEVN